MIPDKKKTLEELAALREELGIPESLPEPGAHRSRPLPQIENAPPPEEKNPEPTPVPVPPSMEIRPAPVLDPARPDAIPTAELSESVLHLNVPPAPFRDSNNREPVLYHSLRKNELPLAPAPAVTHKTQLPTRRQAGEDLARFRKSEAVAKLQQPGIDPASHLRSITASPWLLAPAYLLALSAGVTIWQRFHHVTPLALLIISSSLTAFVFLKKIRSRHHCAILFIIILMTLVFGGRHYAPLFQNAP